MVGKTNAREMLEYAFLLLVLVVVTIAFAMLIAPFIGAILWGVIASILFLPMYDRLCRAWPGRRNLAALATLTVIIAVVIIPAMLLGLALVSQASSAYDQIQAGNFDLARVFVQFESHLPKFMRDWLSEMGLADFETVRTRIGRNIASSFQGLAGQVLNLSQSALAFFLALGVMLYLTFFLLRDGRSLVSTVERCLPMATDQRRLLVQRFVEVVRATIKGSVIVAILQGLIGGVVFWSLGINGALLWGVAMGIFSLFPAIGTGLIWVPVSIYLFATGQVWQGSVLFLCGFLIISSVDNVVRPILVGRDARMPDYVVLIATLGGFELMGFNGFVIGPVIAALFMAAWQIFAESQVEGVEANDPALAPAAVLSPPA
jgi:predicted PurR-regulated permease PerM